MCGRFNLLATPEQLCEAFQLAVLPAYQRCFNISPGQAILNITCLPDKSYQAAYTHWGLVPSWAKDPKMSSHLINARAETLSEKPSFRSAYQKRRCLIPASGFYEWASSAQGKQAYHIFREDQQVFAFAGLWEYWEREGTALYSCTIITTAANALIQPIHDRMPIIIAREHYPQWLNSGESGVNLQHLLSTNDYAGMTLKPVSPWVNNPAHNDANCVH